MGTESRWTLTAPRVAGRSRIEWEKSTNRPQAVSLAPHLQSRRRPPWLPALAAVLCAALTTAMGAWQFSRANEKQALQSARDATATMPALDLADVPATDATDRRVRVRGHFVEAFQIYLDNRNYQGRTGYQVVAPLVYQGGVVLVNRGWIAAGPTRDLLPAVPTPTGEVTLEGLLVPAQGRYLELSSKTSDGPLWENLDLERYRAWYRQDLQDRLLLQATPVGDGLARDWPRPDSGVERHLGYASQWFALTGLIIVLYLYYGMRKPCAGSC